MQHVYEGTNFSMRVGDKTAGYAFEAEIRGTSVMGVKGKTILSKIPSFDIIQGFVIDILHTVELVSS